MPGWALGAIIICAVLITLRVASNTKHPSRGRGDFSPEHTRALVDLARKQNPYA